MSDDWRLRVHLPGDGRSRLLAETLAAGELEQELQEALAGRVAVSHDKDDVFVYAASRQDADRARALISSLADRNGWQVQTELARWHPVAEEWEDPEQPLPSDPGDLAAEHAERIRQEREESSRQGYPDFEVRVRCPSRRDAVELQERLQAEDIPSARRWHYLLIGAPDEDTAASLAERLRAEAPAGSEVSAELSGQATFAVRPGNPFAVFGGLGG